MIDIKIIFIYSAIILIYSYATIEAFEKILEGIKNESKKRSSKKSFCKKRN